MKCIAHSRLLDRCVVRKGIPTSHVILDTVFCKVLDFPFHRLGVTFIVVTDNGFDFGKGSDPVPTVVRTVSPEVTYAHVEDVVACIKGNGFGNIVVIGVIVCIININEGFVYFDIVEPNCVACCICFNSYPLPYVGSEFIVRCSKVELC